MRDRKVYLQWGAAAALQSCRCSRLAELQGKCPLPAPAMQPDALATTLLLSGRELAGSGAVDEGKMVLQWCLGSNRREHWLTNFCSCGSLSDEMNARYSSELL